jgi:hypothetical protein
MMVSFNLRLYRIHDLLGEKKKGKKNWLKKSMLLDKIFHVLALKTSSKMFALLLWHSLTVIIPALRARGSGRVRDGPAMVRERGREGGR